MVGEDLAYEVPQDQVRSISDVERTFGTIVLLPEQK